MRRLRLPTDGIARPRDDSRLILGGTMRRRFSGRRRRSVGFGRLAAWLSFGGAVLSQAALLAAGYFLSDDASPTALRNAAIAGGLIVLGLIVMVLARRAGKRAQAKAVDLGRVSLRLVADADHGDASRRSRPAA